jgi:hypothetical protein
MTHSKAQSYVLNSKRNLLAASIMCVAVPLQVLAQDDLEEVLITGSYIKSAGTDEASPI